MIFLNVLLTLYKLKSIIAYSKFLKFNVDWNVHGGDFQQVEMKA